MLDSDKNGKSPDVLRRRGTEMQFITLAFVALQPPTLGFMPRWDKTDDLGLAGWVNVKPASKPRDWRR